MKRSKKVTIGIIIFFIIVATVIGGRTAMGVYFKKKFGKRPPPGVVVEIVSEKKFSRLCWSGSVRVNQNHSESVGTRSCRRPKGPADRSGR